MDSRDSAPALTRITCRGDILYSYQMTIGTPRRHLTLRNTFAQQYHRNFLTNYEHLRSECTFRVQGKITEKSDKKRNRSSLQHNVSCQMDSDQL